MDKEKCLIYFGLDDYKNIFWRFVDHASQRHEIKLIVKQILCIKLVKYWDKNAQTRFFL